MRKLSIHLQIEDEEGKGTHFDIHQEISDVLAIKYNKSDLINTLNLRIMNAINETFLEKRIKPPLSFEDIFLITTTKQD